MIVYTPAKAATVVPLIDLAPSWSDDPAQRQAVAWEIHKACRDTGFFYVVGHGIAQGRLDDQLDLARDFFALPDAEKREVDISRSPVVRGYEAVAAQTLDEGSPPDLKEGFLLGCDLGPSHPYVQRQLPNTGANQWPRRPADFRARYDAYIAEMLRVDRHLMRLLALSLDLEADYFADGMAEPIYNSRLLHYPPLPASVAANQLGAGAHTDWGLLTLLLQDDVGGLEVRNADGDWILAPPVHGALVVNLGDMVPVLTNGLYQSTPHRVLNNTSGRDRYSCATFIDPDYDYRVRCVPTCLPADGTAPVADTTVGEHIAAMYRKTYGRAT